MGWNHQLEHISCVFHSICPTKHPSTISEAIPVESCLLRGIPLCWTLPFRCRVGGVGYRRCRLTVMKVALDVYRDFALKKTTTEEGHVWSWCVKLIYVVVSFFYFHHYLGKISHLTNIFHMGWNHQPDMKPANRLGWFQNWLANNFPFERLNVGEVSFTYWCSTLPTPYCP